MRPNRVLIAIVLTTTLLILVSALLPQTVYADCGVPGTPPCSTGGDKRKVATRTPLPTHTAIAIQPLVPLLPLSGGGVSTPTPPPVQLTAIAQIKTAVALTTTPTPTPSITPTSNPLVPPSNRPIVTPVAGPVLVPPGTAVMIIIVALVTLLVAGGVFLMRRLRTSGTQRPPSPNRDQGPGSTS